MVDQMQSKPHVVLWQLTREPVPAIVALNGACAECAGPLVLMIVLETSTTQKQCHQPPLTAAFHATAYSCFSSQGKSGELIMHALHFLSIRRAIDWEGRWRRLLLHHHSRGQPLHVWPSQSPASFVNAEHARCIAALWCSSLDMFHQHGRTHDLSHRCSCRQYWHAIAMGLPQEQFSELLRMLCPGASCAASLVPGTGITMLASELDWVDFGPWLPLRRCCRCPTVHAIGMTLPTRSCHCKALPWGITCCIHDLILYHANYAMWWATFWWTTILKWQLLPVLKELWDNKLWQLNLLT